MNLVQLIFSPTGGTQRVAGILAEAWGGSQVIDLTDPNLPERVLNPTDLALIALPSYGGRVPALAAQRLGKIQGNGAACVLVCVYGNREFEDTLVEMEDLAKAAGFRVAAAVAAVAEHSILRQYAAGRPDGDDTAQLKAFARSIQTKLENQPEAPVPQLPGNRPYKKTSGGGMVPAPGKECVSCGLCAKKCPAQAIDPKAVSKVDKDACIHCMRCVSVCPQKTRKVNGVMLSAAALALKPVCSSRKENRLFL